MTKTTKVPVPKGWRELRAGTKICQGDQFWAWNTGPWTIEDGLENKLYRPMDRFKCTQGYPTHVTYIRRIQPRRTAGGRKGGAK